MTIPTLFSTAKKYLLTALLPSLALFATLALAAAPVRAESVIATVEIAYPQAIAVNPLTNNIYVTDNTGAVLAIDGVTNGFSAVAGGLSVGEHPFDVAVNPVTNKIYAADFYGATITVIDGATHSVITVPVAGYPRTIAVNSVTNKIYVAHMFSSTVTVIDGASNAITTVTVGSYPTGIAVNPVTNQIYVTNIIDGTVSVIDGDTNSSSTVATVASGSYPAAIAINPVTNKVYVPNGSSVTVIDGASNSATSVETAGPVAGNTGQQFTSIVVNPVTNKIYVANYTNNTVTVIDGASNSTTIIAAGTNPFAIALNLDTNRIYVANAGSSDVTVIDGSTNNTTATLAVGNDPRAIALNPVTNRVYVANTYNVSVIGELDSTPPVIISSQTPLPNANGWNNTDVTVTFTATDDVSIPTCIVNSATLTVEGAGQVVSTTCTDAAGNSASASHSVSIDKTAPMLTMPGLAGNYTVGSSVVLSFAATDTLSGLASVSATLNGNPVSSGSTVVLNHLGSNTFTLTATDKAGNTATQTQHFTVGYGFGGFLPPLTADSRTTFHLGSIIPVKFDLYDANGAAISTAVAHLSLQQFSGDEPVGDPIDATPTSGADSGNLFRYSGGHYMYNLSTKPFTTGTWRIQATLDDGTVRTIEIGLTSK